MWITNKKMNRTKDGGEYVFLTPNKDNKNIRISRALAERINWTEKMMLEVYIDKEKVMLRMDDGVGNGFPFYPAAKNVKSIGCQFHQIADCLKRSGWAAGRYKAAILKSAKGETYLSVEKETQRALF